MWVKLLIADLTLLSWIEILPWLRVRLNEEQSQLMIKIKIEIKMHIFVNCDPKFWLWIMLSEIKEIYQVTEWNSLLTYFLLWHVEKDKLISEELLIVSK